MFEWEHRPQKTIKIGQDTKYAPFYYRWRQMKARCESEKTKEVERYKNRNIFVCDEWQDFWVFFDWCVLTFEEGKTIDRIDNDGPYAPHNCRWATPKEQAVTARRTQARVNGIKIAQRAHLASLYKKWGDPKTRSKKHCFKCKTFKLLKEFNKAKGTCDGLQKHCSECQKKYHASRKK